MTATLFNSYDAVGKAEDVSNIVSNIAPTNTPMLTLIGTETADNTIYQWQEDSLDAPAVNAQVEGAAAISANMVATVMRNNTTQIFEKTISVTGTQMKMKMHGPKEWARQQAKKAKEIKRDLEYALVGTRQTSVTGSSTVARQFNGVQAQFDSGVTLANGGTTRALTEALFVSAQQAAYTQGTEPTHALIKPSDSLVVAGFAAATGRLREIGDEGKEVVNVVDIYQSPFGRVKFVMDRWQATVDCILVDPSMWKLRPYRPWNQTELAKVGDSRQAMLLGEYGLSHRNYKAGALLTDLS